MSHTLEELCQDGTIGASNVTTIRDIAEQAGVSVAAVSLALNGKPGVGAETRKRVLRIASELDYKRPGGATGRVPQKLGTVRFLKVSQHGHTVNRDHNVFISDYIDGISEVAVERSYNLEVVGCENADMEELVRSLDDRSIAGAIVLGTELSYRQVALFDDVDVPVVFLDTYYPFLQFDFVDMDNLDAVYKIVSEFVAAGHRRIGLVTSPVQVENFRLRDAGFARATRELGIASEDTITIPLDSTYDGSYADMKRYLDEGGDVPTALFCVNDMIAYGCVAALKDSGMRVPEDVSVIGFDNLPQSERHAPPLTTIDVQKHTMGGVCMSMLIDRIEDGHREPTRKLVIGAELVRRDSVSRRA